MMSHRGKRQALSKLDDITPIATKRRKGRASTTAEEEEASPLEQRQSYSTVASIASDMKISSIYNRSVTDAPAELFRKDLISAMKLPDSEPLTSDHYWVITDQWKQEWERGVQVPVKPDSLPGPVVTLTNSNVNNSRKMHHEFKLPKNKYIRITKNEHFRVDEHYLSNVGIQAEKCCAYDLEDVDLVWLNIVNGERALMGLTTISQDQLERVIEELEMRCWEKVHTIVKKEEGLALEYDESVICDVCRSPDSEDGNEMVFCDCCNICVHQACYGITSIPAGSWLCRTCSLGLRPECVLCPNKNGAMKSTRSGQKWAHVSCALWIPEVSIGCVEKMEPITKISSIPQSRWALICVLCRERVGACIQCSVKTCKTAYHVTCAFKHGLEMRAIIDEDNTADDDNTVKLRSYCQKHSITSKNRNSNVEGAGSDEEVKKKLRKDLTMEEKSHARAVKVQEIEAEFEKHVTIKDITRKYDVDAEGLEYIYNYWVLKRRASFNKPLLAARNEDASDLLNKNQEQVDQEKMRMFVQLRQDLERVRNLCYMVGKREKLSRSYQRLREQTFYKQAALLSDTRINLSKAEITSIKEANHGPSIYDRLYSHANAPDLSTDFDTMVCRIAGRSESELSPGLSFNGYVSGKNGKRSCFNGDIRGVRKNSGFYESLSSSATSDIDSKSHAGMDTESDTRIKVNNRMNKSQRKNNVENRIKNTARRRNKSSTAMYLDSTTSTEGDDDIDDNKSNSSRLSQRSKKSATNSKKQLSATSRSFELLERRMLGSRSCSVTAAEEDDSEDEFFPLPSKTKGGFNKKAVSEIYSSDTDSSCSMKNSDKDLFGSTSKPIRTKASVKEFPISGGSHRSSKDRAGTNGLNKSVTFSSTKTTSTLVTDKEKRVNEKSSTAASNCDMLMLVPQRAAAKKAIKAIEHIKNGMVKPTTVFDDTENDSFRVAKSSKLLKVSTSDVTNSVTNQTSVTCSTSFITSSVTVTSSIITSSISHVSTATDVSTAQLSSNQAVKKSSTSSSGSSSGSSTGGSSSSSSSSSYSTSSSSSSSDSSSSAMSSSSSSESEAEDTLNTPSKTLIEDKIKAESRDKLTLPVDDQSHYNDKASTELMSLKSESGSDLYASCPFSVDVLQPDSNSGQPFSNLVLPVDEQSHYNVKDDTELVSLKSESVSDFPFSADVLQPDSDSGRPLSNLMLSVDDQSHYNDKDDTGLLSLKSESVSDLYSSCSLSADGLQPDSNSEQSISNLILPVDERSPYTDKDDVELASLKSPSVSDFYASCPFPTDVLQPEPSPGQPLSNLVLPPDDQSHFNNKDDTELVSLKSPSVSESYTSCPFPTDVLQPEASPGQPLSIQMPCTATASFTTTSQNMAIITSIISPVPALNSDETTTVTPVSGSSVNFDEKFAEMISETPVRSSPTAEIATAPSEQTTENLSEKNLTESRTEENIIEKNKTEEKVPEKSIKEVINNDKNVSDHAPLADANTYSTDKEKENLCSNVVEVTNETVPNKRRRGRGRGRGRGRNSIANCFLNRDRDADTFHSKLVGTVYDFDDDDELTGDTFENLRAMRERRKSTDTAYCDRFSTSSKDTCYSPKFASPSSQLPQQSRRKGSAVSTPDRRSSHRTQLSPLCEISNNGRVLSKDLHRDNVDPPENDNDDEEEEEDEQAEEEEDDEEEEENSPCENKPVNVVGESEMTVNDNTNHNQDNILQSTFSPTNLSNSEPLPDIVDELEKEIQRYSTLPTSTNRSSKTSPSLTASPRVLSEALSSSEPALHSQTANSSPNQYLVSKYMDNALADSSAVLLDDDSSISRNQLRVKIKGPYSDVNYVPTVTTTTSAASIQQLPSASSSNSVIPADACYAVSAGTLNTSVSSAASSSNLRRMRKKELLRQYWTQDMNMDECGNDIAVAINQNSGISGDACFGPPSNTPVKIGPSYKLPKAVASMTTIPTKEDYKAVLDAAYIEKKKRGKDKTSSAVFDAADISNNNANAVNSNFSSGNNNNNNNNNNILHNNNKQSTVSIAKSPDKKSSYAIVNSSSIDDNQDPIPVLDNHVMKRKSRSTSSSSAHPKLKIKIGGMLSVVVENSGSATPFEEKNLRLRPPKKRLCDQTEMQRSHVMMEQLKRECMRYRSKVISEFNENGDRYDGGGDDDYSDNDLVDKNACKEVGLKKKRKRSSNAASSQKSNKRKKKQQRSSSRSNDGVESVTKDEIVRVITNVESGEGAPKKIIIKFGGLNASAVACEPSFSSSPPLSAPSPAKPPKSSKRNFSLSN